MIPEWAKQKVATAVGRYGLYPALDVQHTSVVIPDLPPALEGFQIAHVSDLHVGEGEWAPPNIPAVEAALHRERPDLLVNTGDFVMAEPPADRVAEFVRPLAEAIGDVPHVAVLGNHDFYPGEEHAAALIQTLSGLGIEILHNRAIRIERDGAVLTVVGLTQEFGDHEIGLRALSEASRPRVLLAHTAEEVELLPPGGADLALAGHTHGGQVSPRVLAPFIVRWFNGSRFVEGWYQVNRIPTYINRGLGATGLPIRFGAHPELTFIRLTSGRD